MDKFIMVLFDSDGDCLGIISGRSAKRVLERTDDKLFGIAPFAKRIVRYTNIPIGALRDFERTGTILKTYWPLNDLRRV